MAAIHCPSCKELVSEWRDACPLCQTPIKAQPAKLGPVSLPQAEIELLSLDVQRAMLETERELLAREREALAAPVLQDLGPSEETVRGTSQPTSGGCFVAIMKFVMPGKPLNPRNTWTQEERLRFLEQVHAEHEDRARRHREGRMAQLVVMLVMLAVVVFLKHC